MFAPLGTISTGRSQGHSMTYSTFDQKAYPFIFLQVNFTGSCGTDVQDSELTGEIDGISFGFQDAKIGDTKIDPMRGTITVVPNQEWDFA